MADSSFWRDLADQFRALPLECKMLRADRYPVNDITDELSDWHLSGTATATALVDALARRAASEIPNPPTFDLLQAWLEVLIKRGGVRFHSQTISTGNNPDGTARPKRTIGSLYQLPEHSANYCKMLESEALQTEAEEKRRNDPKNWSRFRAEYEVFKKLRDMRTGPHEQVPEAFVRDAISRRLGIKPEEVTWEQIRHEVAALLPYYPAITLLPTPGSTLESLGNLPQMQKRRKRKRKSHLTRKETVAKQIQRLRTESNLTVDQLAEKVGLDVRNVTRHISGKTKPRLSNLAAYERVFSEALGRKVTIKKMP
jgi:DNA-binding transcriptional regulator YiaG